MTGKLIEALNRALQQEHACHIRYKTHAVVVRGPYAETVASRLKEIAEDEEKHADMLREQIDNLGGKITMDVAASDLVPAETLEEILEVNIREEQKAIGMYREIMRNLSEAEMTWLFETLEEILSDEEEHLYQLLTLKGKS